MYVLLQGLRCLLSLMLVVLCDIVLSQLLGFISQLGKLGDVVRDSLACLLCLFVLVIVFIEQCLDELASLLGCCSVQRLFLGGDASLFLIG